MGQDDEYAGWESRGSWRRDFVSELRSLFWLGTHRSKAKQHFVAERTVSTLLSTGAKGASKAW